MGTQGDNGSTEKKLPWRLLTPKREMPADEALVPASPVRNLPLAWRVLLLGDGSVTNFLETAALCRVGVHLIGEHTSDTSDIILREVVLVSHDGHRLAHAMSEWSAEDLRQQLPEANKPIWRNLVEQRREIFREVQTLAEARPHQDLRLKLAYQQDLSDDECDLLWSRKYVLYSGSRVLTRVQETFSPQLNQIFI